MKYNILMILLLVFFGISCSSQTPKQYICYQANNEIIIDGKIDEKDWSKAEWSDYFQDIEGDKKPKPRFKTRIKMLWDDQYLYFAAELEEPHIWATLTERESIIFNDNDFEIFLDPDGDTHNYFEFEINAFGTVWDLYLTKPYRSFGHYIDAWDIKGLKSAVYIDGTINDPSDIDKKWTVEIAIPMEILTEINTGEKKPESGDIWRINFSRVQWQTDITDGKYKKKTNPGTGKPLPEDNWVWNPIGVISIHMPEKWGYLQFSERKVGNIKEQIIENPDQQLISELWEIFYAELEYKKKHQKFTRNINDLQLPESINDALFTIETTSSQLEIIARSSRSNYNWHLNQDGRIWKAE